MPSQPAFGYLLSGRDLLLLTFPSHEWALLTRLPAQVMIAAMAADPGGERRTVADGLAGLNAIAAGAVSRSELVRAVVAAIYAEAEPEPPRAEPDVTDVLTACRAASDVLAARAGARDADAYRRWLRSIAAQVCASRSGGLLGVLALRPAEREFLAALREALRPG